MEAGGTIGERGLAPLRNRFWKRVSIALGRIGHGKQLDALELRNAFGGGESELRELLCVGIGCEDACQQRGLVCVAKERKFGWPQRQAEGAQNLGGGLCGVDEQRRGDGALGDGNHGAGAARAIARLPLRVERKTDAIAIAPRLRRRGGTAGHEPRGLRQPYLGGAAGSSRAALLARGATAAQAVGLALVAAALLLLGSGNAGSRKEGMGQLLGLILPLFLVTGLGQLAARIFSAGAPAENTYLYTATLFAGAAIAALVALATRPVHPQRQDLWLGLLLGATNTITNLSLLSALRELPSALVFSISSAASVALLAITGVLFWRERLSRRRPQR